MIHIVTAENRGAFRLPLLEMHRHRKAIFVDTLRWNVPVVEGLEIDAFDAPEAIYLLECPPAQTPLTGSLRLLPTERPHLLGDIFSDLCAGGPPRGPRIWEASRFCPSPLLEARSERHALFARMIAAILEAGLLFDIEAVTFVASAALAPLARDVGWSVRTLGPVRRRGREKIVAMQAEISIAGLRAVRARHAIAGPLARFSAPDPAAAIAA